MSSGHKRINVARDRTSMKVNIMHHEILMFESRQICASINDIPISTGCIEKQPNNVAHLSKTSAGVNSAVIQGIKSKSHLLI